MDVFFMEAPPRFELGVKVLQTSALPLGYGAIWSGRRDSNSRRSPWQGDALPLSHSRILVGLFGPTLIIPNKYPKVKEKIRFFLFFYSSRLFCNSASRSAVTE